MGVGGGRGCCGTWRRLAARRCPEEPFRFPAPGEPPLPQGGCLAPVPGAPSTLGDPGIEAGGRRSFRLGSLEGRPPPSARNRPAAERAERPREPAQPRILHSPPGKRHLLSPLGFGAELKRPPLPPNRPRPPAGSPGPPRGRMGSAERPWLPQARGEALPRPTPAPFSAPSPPVPRRQTASFSPGRQPALPEGAPGGGCPSESSRESLRAAPQQRRRSRAGPSTRRSGAWVGCRGLLLRSSEVPPGVAERFILSGYRCPGSSAAQCLLSAFRPSNETGNFWTHFVALFASRFLEPFRAPGGSLPPGPPEPFYYPLWSYCLGVCGLLSASSMAPLFNAMSLPVREICCYIDYGTISAYTVGASLASVYYLSPPAAPEPASPSSGCPEGAGRAGAWFETLYVPTPCLAALFCTLACCSPRRRYLLRTLVFLLPFVVVSVPVFQKLWGPGGSPGTGRLFLRHCLWLLASGLLNVSKAPERFSPGKFDIWGHCCSFMSILDELRMISGEMELLAEGRPLLSRAPTFLSTFGVMLLALALLATMVAWFGVRARGGRYQDQSEAQKAD